MVHGINKIKEYFSDLSDSFVVIGGTACDLLMAGEGVEFRTTKDIDIVFLFHKPSREFGDRFIRFLNDGQYNNCERSDGKPVYYRFKDPSELTFPSIIELFSGDTSIEIKDKVRRFRKISFTSMVSLSAILVDSNYYELIQNGVIIVQGIPVLARQYLILFKIKAFLDLSERKENGEQVDSKDIKKHRNDIFRLSQYLSEMDIVPVKPDIEDDVRKFIKAVETDPSINLKAIGSEISKEGLLNILRTIYKINN